MRKIEGIIPTSYADALRALDGKPAKRLNANTSLIRVDDRRIHLRLHDTFVVGYHSDGWFVLNTGGWRTVTTKARINAALRLTPFAVYQKKGAWYVWNRRDDKSEGFSDGMILSAA